MNLELTPNEYLGTSRAVYETALAYQNARHRGAEQAKKDEVERKDAERRRRDEKRKKAELHQIIWGGE